MPAGRPTDYDPKYCDEIIEYFRREPTTTLYKREFYKDGTIKSEIPILTAAQLPTFEKFADEIGVHRDTLNEWTKKHKEFSDAYAHAKKLQEHIWVVNGLGGLYNAQFAQFYGKNCLGYKDQQEIKLTEVPIDPDEQKQMLSELINALPDEEKRKLLES
jgi:hypothetical protein